MLLSGFISYVGVKLIKAGAKAIAPSLSKLFNLCLSTATPSADMENC